MGYNYKLTQIARMDGRDCFVEALNSAFDIGKVLLSFQTYDQRRSAGDRITNKIDVYLDFGEFLFLYNEVVETDRFVEGSKLGKKILDTLKQLEGAANSGDQGARQRLNKAKSSGYDESKAWSMIMKPYYMGGSRSSKDRDGNPEARKMTLMVGDRQPFIIKAESGPGKVNPKTRGIMFNGRADKTVTIASSEKDFISFLSVIKANLDAYLSAYYINIGRTQFEYVTDDKKLDQNDGQYRNNQAGNQYGNQSRGYSNQNNNQNSNQYQRNQQAKKPVNQNSQQNYQSNQQDQYRQDSGNIQNQYQQASQPEQTGGFFQPGQSGYKG